MQTSLPSAQELKDTLREIRCITFLDKILNNFMASRIRVKSINRGTPGWLSWSGVRLLTLAPDRRVLSSSPTLHCVLSVEPVEGSLSPSVPLCSWARSLSPSLN